VAEALETAHEHGIVHRDLKPANVKITRDGVVKVWTSGSRSWRFSRRRGHCRRPARVATLPHMTGAGVIVGTPAYMSPEQARGERADQRSDIWAFGCVLYEMLAGGPRSAPTRRRHTRARAGERAELEALPKGVPKRVRTSSHAVSQRIACSASRTHRLSDICSTNQTPQAR
jgi:serine/threonine protein kinase